MINDLETRVINLFEKSEQVTSMATETIAMYLIYLKYMCEIGEIEYEKIIYSDEIFDVFHIPRIVSTKINNNGIIINGMLRNFKETCAKDMVLAFLKNQKSNLDIYQVNDEKIIYMIGGLVRNCDFSLYDTNGKTTYISDSESVDRLYEYFKLFDKVLGIHNDYKSISDVEYEKYDYLCIYDNAPRYLQRNSNLNNYIYGKINVVKNIILFSKYSKISNFKDGRLVAKYIKTIVIKGNNTAIFFDKDATEISIINGNNSKIQSSETIDEIIKKNRKQKDVLVKTNYQELKNNNMRIGFNLYQMEKSDHNININKIVNENTNYLKELNSLNDIVEMETNKIFNL